MLVEQALRLHPVSHTHPPVERERETGVSLCLGLSPPPKAECLDHFWERGLTAEMSPMEGCQIKYRTPG